MKEVVLGLLRLNKRAQKGAPWAVYCDGFTLSEPATGVKPAPKQWQDFFSIRSGQTGAHSFYSSPEQSLLWVIEAVSKTCFKLDQCLDFKACFCDSSSSSEQMWENQLSPVSCDISLLPLKIGITGMNKSLLCAIAPSLNCRSYSEPRVFIYTQPQTCLRTADEYKKFFILNYCCIRQFDSNRNWRVPRGF